MPNHCTFSVSMHTQSMAIHRIICIDPATTHRHPTIQWFSDHIAIVNVVGCCGSNVQERRLLVWQWRWRSVIRFQCRRCGRWMLEITFSYIRWSPLWIVGRSIRWLIRLTFRFIIVTAINITWNRANRFGLCIGGNSKMYMRSAYRHYYSCWWWNVHFWWAFVVCCVCNIYIPVAVCTTAEETSEIERK